MPARAHALLTLTATFLVASAAVAEHDWPQWRGVERTGASTETEWSSTGSPTPLWLRELGNGHSAFAISNGSMYTLGHNMDAGEDVVYCFDAETGEERWTYRYPADIWDYAHDGGTLTTPTVVGDVVYTSNREGKVFCLDRATGEMHWTRDARAELEVEPHTWGFASSPLVLGEKVVLNYGPVVAFNRADGDVVWRTERSFGNAYSTPAVFDFHGETLLAVLNGDGLGIVHADDGSEIAFAAWSKEPNIYPMTPVIVDGDRVFISGGYERGAAMFRLVEQEEGHALELLWESRVMRNKMSGCVLWEGHLYGFDEAILKCIDLDGNEMWRKRGLGTGSMTIAGGRMVIMTGRGDLVIADASPESYNELSRQHVLDDGTFWTTPTLCNGLVYCRSSLGAMACLDYRGTGEAAPEITTEQPDALPVAADVFAQHVQAVGGVEALKGLRNLHFVGEGESLRNTVAKGPVEVRWSRDGGFEWSAESGFRFGHHDNLGWLVGTYAGPLTISDDALAALREAGDLQRFLHPEHTYQSIRTAGIEQFDDRTCYVVEATTGADTTRRLFFDRESGLYAGQDAPGTHMWIVDEYTDVDGVRVPMQWSLYEPESGEMDSAVFTTVTVNAVDTSEIEPPAIIARINQTPEQLAADTERLRREYAELLGTWDILADDEQPGATARIRADDGFLWMEWPEFPPDRLTDPEDDRFVIIAFPDVAFTIQRDDAGDVESIAAFEGGSRFAQLTKQADAPITQGETHIWPQFRGVGARGIAAGPAPPTHWNVETGENILWKTPVPGLAHSSPVIWGDRMFITSAVRHGEGEDELVVGLYGSIDPVDDDSIHDMNVYCLDRRTGEILWERTAISAVPKVKRHPKGSHAASTPATDGTHVVAFFASEGLYCYDIEGELLWSKDFGVLDSGYFQVPDAQWGFASSPIIHDGRVIVQCDVQENSFVAAFDITTGEELWKTPRNDVPTWSTPTVHAVDGHAQVICNGWKHAASYDLATGEERWHLEGGGDIPVPTPIVVHDLIYLTSAHGREAPIRAIHADARGDLNENREATIKWEHTRRGNYMQTPIVLGDTLYLCSDSGILAAYDAVTGEEHYRERIGAGRMGFTASIVACEDILYITGEAGSIHVVRAAKTYEPIVVNEMNEECMATPAILDGVLYYRTRSHVVAIGN